MNRIKFKKPVARKSTIKMLSKKEKYERKRLKKRDILRKWKEEYGYE
jgi:hypothetical protein